MIKLFKRFRRDTQAIPAIPVLSDADVMRSHAAALRANSPYYNPSDPRMHPEIYDADPMGYANRGAVGPRIRLDYGCDSCRYMHQVQSEVTIKDLHGSNTERNTESTCLHPSFANPLDRNLISNYSGTRTPVDCPFLLKYLEKITEGIKERAIHGM